MNECAEKRARALVGEAETNLIIALSDEEQKVEQQIPGTYRLLGSDLGCAA